MAAPSQSVALRPVQQRILYKTTILLGGYGLFLLLTLAGTIYSINASVRQLQKSMDEFQGLTQDVESLNEAFVRQAKERKNLLLRGHNLEDFEQYSDRINHLTNQIQTQSNNLLDQPLAQPYHHQLQAFRDQHAQLMQTYDQGISRFQTTQSHIAGDQIMRGHGKQVGQTLTEVLEQIRRDRQRYIRQEKQELQKVLLLSTSSFIILIITGSGLLMAAITAPIRRVVRFTHFLESSIPISAKIDPLPSSPSVPQPTFPTTNWQPTYFPLKGHKSDEIGYMVKTYNDLLSRLNNYNQQLQTRDSLLRCVNGAVQCLVANDDLTLSLPQMLEILARGTHQSRAYILQLSHDDQTQEQLFHLTHEWDAPNIPTKEEAGGRFPVPVSAFPARLTNPLKAGQSTQFLARELDSILPAERLPGQSRSLVGVPITVAGEWWGLLGLDNCEQECSWSEAEIVVLATVATALGNAIEGERARKVREAAQRNALLERERAARADQLEAANQVLSTRDRWLETTAIAANQLLLNANVADNVTAALKTLGENLACDRLGIMVQLPQASNQPKCLGNFQLLYEWNSPGTINQMANKDLVMWPASDLVDWLPQLMNGAPVGGTVTEQIEPFRNKLQILGILSTYAVPIFLGQHFWGLMFMDYCREARQLTPPELSVFKTAATCVGSAIYQNKVRREQAAQEQEQQKATLVNALTDERNRLAREMHDTLAQAFTGISLQLEAVRSLTGPATQQPAKSAQVRLDQAHSYILRARDLARQGLFEARQSVLALRAAPLETDTLPTALSKALERTQRDTGLKTRFQLQGTEIPLSDGLQLNLLRIAQEAITNTLRHADATQLTIDLSFAPKQIQLCISDNGKGFDPASPALPGGFGLIGIRERLDRFYGYLYLTSTPGSGTTLDITIPLDGNSES